MKNCKRILLVDNVVTLSNTCLRLREHREIDTMLENRKYCPYIVLSEPVPLNKLRCLFAKNSFGDNRIEVYRVPNLVIGSLSSNQMLGRIGKFMFGLCNIVFQFVYLLHLTLLVLSLAIVKKIDLIHAHNPPDLTGIASLFVSKITKIPYVFEIHDRTPELYCGDLGFTKSSFVFKFLKMIEGIVVSNSKGLVTVNNQVATYFKLYRGPVPTAIYTGTKFDIIEQKNNPTMIKKLQNKNVILYQGTLNLNPAGKPSIYDLALPLKAMKRILIDDPDALLVYVGAGTGKLILEKKAKSMGLASKVIFTGFIPQEHVFNWINIAKVVLIPYADNPNNHTTVPSKLYEYMAVGKPIVATRFPGILEILKDEYNGLLYTVGSVDDFSASVLSILTDPILANKLSSNAKSDYLNKYTLSKNWSKLISLYDSLTK